MKSLSLCVTTVPHSNFFNFSFPQPCTNPHLLNYTHTLPWAQLFIDLSGNRAAWTRGWDELLKSKLCIQWPVQCHFLHFHCLSYFKQMLLEELHWRKVHTSVLHKKSWITIYPELKSREMLKLSSKYYFLNLSVTLFQNCVITNIFRMYLQISVDNHSRLIQPPKGQLLLQYLSQKTHSCFKLSKMMFSIYKYIFFSVKLLGAYQ